MADWLGTGEKDARTVSDPKTAARRRRRSRAATAAGEADWEREEQPGVLRRLGEWTRLGRLRLGTQYKLALGSVFLGSFLIGGGFFLGYADRLGSWGYVGAFVISLASSATVVLPAPGAIVIVQMAKDFDPLLLGLITGIGGGLGGVTAYMAGAAGRNVVGQGRVSAWMGRLFQSRWGPILLFASNLVPAMPGDALSAIAGVIRYPLTKYFFYVTTSTILKMIILAFIGKLASGWLLDKMESFL